MCEIKILEEIVPDTYIFEWLLVQGSFDDMFI